MSLKIRRNNGPIRDTFNDEDIQKEFDAIKFGLPDDNIFDAYEKYQELFGRFDMSRDLSNVLVGYKPKSLKELQDWIQQQNDKGVKVLDVRWIDVSDMTDLSYCFSYTRFTDIEGLRVWNMSKVENASGMFRGCLALAGK